MFAFVVVALCIDVHSEAVIPVSKTAKKRVGSLPVVAVFADSVFLNGKFILLASESQQTVDENDPVIVKLKQPLCSLRTKRYLQMKSVNLELDREASYSLLFTLANTIWAAGFSDFYLVVRKPSKSGKRAIRIECPIGKYPEGGYAFGKEDCECAHC